VPANHGLEPDDGQRIYNARNEAMQPSEHQSVESAENKSLRGSAPQHIDLLPENQISASSLTLERNKLVCTDHSSGRPSTMGHEHPPPLANRIEFPTRTGLESDGAGSVVVPGVLAAIAARPLPDRAGSSPTAVRTPQEARPARETGN
jgi:hypothetical protein